jgi:hypothetical protein
VTPGDSTVIGQSSVGGAGGIVAQGWGSVVACVSSSTNPTSMGKPASS